MNENTEPSSGGVVILETLPISCVSSVHLWPSDQCRMDIKLYDEVSMQEDQEKMHNILTVGAVSFHPPVVTCTLSLQTFNQVVFDAYL